MPGRAVLLAGLAMTVGAVTLAACGGDDSSSSPEPSFSRVKGLALSTRPLDKFCPKGTEERPEEPAPGDVPVEDGSRVVQCVNPGSVVHYDVYKDEGTRDEAIQKLALAFGESSFFVNGPLVVYVSDPAPSPLADRIKRECGCGEVRTAGAGEPIAPATPGAPPPTPGAPMPTPSVPVP
jgi:hypothetical protein